MPTNIRIDEATTHTVPMNMLATIEKKISSIIRHNRGTTTSANHFDLFLEVMLF